MPGHRAGLRPRSRRRPDAATFARVRKALDWVADADVRLCEEGHVFFGEAFVVPRDERNLVGRIEQAVKEAYGVDWRLQDLTISPVRCLPRDRRPAQPSHPGV